MAKKRTYGTGTVWQDERGRWRGQVRLGGRRYTVSGQTRKEASGKLKDKADAYERGEDVSGPKVDGPPRLGAWLGQWAEDNKPGAAPGTIDLRERAIAHLKPLHEIPIDTLTIADVEGLLERKAAKLGRRSLAILRTVLTQSLAEAERHQIIGWNPCGSDAKGKPRTRLPATARKGRTRRALTLDQARTLLEVARGDGAEVLVVLGLYLGMRPGEIAGLRWCDVDLKARTVTIAQMRRRNPDGTMTFCGRKGSHEDATLAPRIIEDVPEYVIDLLSRHRIAQGHIGGLVVSTRSGEPIDPSHHRRSIKRLAKAAGIFWAPGLTPNELRHSAASLWAAAGYPLPTIQHMLGHTDLRMVSTNYAAHKTAPTAVPVAL
jgi:integrase